MKLQRASGILLHPTSFPNGVLDEHAYRFVDWLAAAGQRWWQVLPLGPPEGITGSPYMSPSAFAGAPTLLADRGARVTRTDAEEFRARNAYWIDDWVDYGGTLEGQVRFEREWQALRGYARERGVRIFGDMPIYVAHDGADHRAHPKLFQHGVVAGVPPDLFAKTGQLWGNPLYDWTAMRADGYRWWVERFRRAFDLVDLTRVDHFRGFAQYWAIPEDAESAVEGEWRDGPGAAVFRAAEAELGALPVVAEDLGVITEPVVRLRHELGFPGMVVLQFGIGGDPGSPHLPANHEQQAVAYTGTHDNDTSRGWYEAIDHPGTRDWVHRYLNTDGKDIAWVMIKAVLESPADTAIVPVQDLLNLGSEARMNRPGVATGNWGWRMSPGALTPEILERLGTLTRESRRSRSGTKQTV